MHIYIYIYIERFPGQTDFEILGVARGLPQERPPQFQHGNVRVKSWQPMSNSWSPLASRILTHSWQEKTNTKSPGQDFVRRSGSQ